MTTDAKVSTGNQDREPEMFGSGSDIVKAHPDQVVTIINDTHILVLNAYPVFRPQYLLLTQDSQRSQDEPLSFQDVAAAVRFLFSVADPHYVLYNCTATSGCSRKHKHMQALKKPGIGEAEESSSFRFFPDTEIPSICAPYQYHLHRFGPPTQLQATGVYELYVDMLSKCKKQIGFQENDTASLCPHNLILTKEWMILIPRLSNEYNGIGANATAMMGMPMMATREILQLWIDNGPARVLRELGVPLKPTEEDARA